MKLTFIALPLLTFVNSVVAQATLIGLPKAGTKVRKGKDLLVQIVKPNEMMGSIEVGLVLSFQYCPPPNPCPSAAGDLGDILYIGKLNAANFAPGEAYENITVTVPNNSFENPGPAQIIETRFHLLGAGPAALLETNAVVVKLVD